MHLRPASCRGLSIVPLTRYPGPLQAYEQATLTTPEGPGEAVPTTEARP